MTQQKETTILLLSLATTLAVLGGGVWLLKDKLLPNQAGSTQLSNNATNGKITGERHSLGQTILLSTDSNPQKQQGVEAFKNNDFVSASELFKASLQTQRNDAEALIYLNNAQAAQQAGQENPVKIATVVPLGGNLNVSKEILRGVAQAQNEINQKGGIQGRKLQVEIVNDDNNADTAQQVAQSLVKDSSILGVVGHNSSTATLAAGPVYQLGQLVVISATATANKISELGDYVFRTVPSYRFEAGSLARYVVKTAKKAKTLLCFDSRDDASQSLREDFTIAMVTEGGQIASVNCDFSAPDFNPNEIIAQGIRSKAESLAIIPSVNRLAPALAFAQANGRKLALFSSSTLYTFQTLQDGQLAVDGLVLAVPWHPDAFRGTAFPALAKQLWGGEVNWRTAMAYDATKVLIAGLEQGHFNRQGIQQTLAKPGFVLSGATGEMVFWPSGDRVGVSLMVKVAPGKRSGTGYDFMLIKP